MRLRTDLRHRRSAAGSPESAKMDREEYLTFRQMTECIEYQEQTLRNMMSGGLFRRGIRDYKRRRPCAVRLVASGAVAS